MSFKNFSSHQFLDKEEIDKICDSIFKLEEHWIHRGKTIVDVPFYTLGASEYMDLEEANKEHYEKIFSEQNPILWNEFEWLYMKTKKFFEDLIPGEYDFYKEKSALPGFHIFLDDDLFEIPIAARHCDLQYRNIDWQGMEYDKSTHISFTVYVKLPKAGGGMNIWQNRYEELEDLESDKRNEILNEAGYEYTSFEEGPIVLHDGHQYHQIAESKEIVEGDKRISFQGHVIKAGDKYWFHW